MNTTPGPWHVQGRYIVPADNGPSIGSAVALKAPSLKKQPDFDAVAHANARLMAAAPELLAALSELVAEADSPQGWDGHPHPHTYGFQMARDILSKMKI
jgi:hypothetical protein